MTKTEQRLLQLKTSLIWQDYEMAEAQLSLLSVLDEEGIDQIIERVESQAYEEALALIEAFINAPKTELVAYQDTELEALRIQLKELEQVIEALSEQQSEQVFLLNEFNTQLSLATGDIVQEILQLRKQIEQEKYRQKQAKIQAAKQALEDEKAALEALKSRRTELEEKLEALDEFDPEFEELEESLESVNEAIRQKQESVREKRQTVKEQEAFFEEATEEAVHEAEAEYEAFEESYQEAKDDKVAALNEEDKGLLKKLYRKAAKLCHPDTAADEMKDQATEMMKLLNQARDQGDLKAIQLLLEKLEKGTAFVLASDMLTDRAQVEEKIAELLAKLESISAEIEAIQESETWQLIETIDSWEAYFKAQQEDLAQYLEQVRQVYERLVNGDLSEDNHSEVHQIKAHHTQSDSKSSFNKQPQPEPASSKSAQSNVGADNYWEEDF